MSFRFKFLFPQVNGIYLWIKLFHRESEAAEWLRSLLFIVDTQYHTFVLNHGLLSPLLLTKRTAINTAAHGLHRSLTAGEVECITSWVNGIIILNVTNIFMVFKIACFT